MACRSVASLTPPSLARSVYGDTLTAVFLCAAGKFNTGHGATGRFYSEPRLDYSPNVLEGCSQKFGCSKQFWEASTRSRRALLGWLIRQPGALPPRRL